MPLPFIAGAVAAKIILGASAATGAVGTAKGIKGAMDSRKADGVQKEAEFILEKAKEKIEDQKDSTSTVIKNLGELKIETSGNELKKFVEEFTKIKNVVIKNSLGLEELNKIPMNKATLGEMRETAIEAKDLLTSGLSGIGAGALLGWGTYGGVMALGTASTGAGIGGLTGIAASNATLAWLGGGSLAAGGGGMALGTAVLGGMVAGPALLLAGGVFGAKAKTKLNNAYSNLSEAKKIEEEINVAIETLKCISTRVKQNTRLLHKLRMGFKSYLVNLEDLVSRKKDWNAYTKEEKEMVAINVKYAQAVKMVIDTPMLNQDGSLTVESEAVLENEALLRFSE